MKLRLALGLAFPERQQQHQLAPQERFRGKEPSVVVDELAEPQVTAGDANKSLIPRTCAPLVKHGLIVRGLELSLDAGRCDLADQVSAERVRFLADGPTPDWKEGGREGLQNF